MRSEVRTSAGLLGWEESSRGRAEGLLGREQFSRGREEGLLGRVYGRLVSRPSVTPVR